MTIFDKKKSKIFSENSDQIFEKKLFFLFELKVTSPSNDHVITIKIHSKNFQNFHQNFLINFTDELFSLGMIQFYIHLIEIVSKLKFFVQIPKISQNFKLRFLSQAHLLRQVFSVGQKWNFGWTAVQVQLPRNFTVHFLSFTVVFKIFVASYFLRTRPVEIILEVSLISFQFELWIIYLDLISRFLTSKTSSKFQFENFRNFRRSHDGSHD